MKTTKPPQNVTASVGSRNPNHRSFIEKNKVVCQKVSTEKITKISESLHFELGTLKQRQKISVRTIGNPNRTTKDVVKTVTNKENIVARQHQTFAATVRKVGTRVKTYSANLAPPTTLQRQIVPRKKMEKKEIVESIGTVEELLKSNRALEQQVSELVHNAESKKAEIAQLKIELNRFKHMGKENLTVKAVEILSKDKSSHHHSGDVQGQIERLQRENFSLRERLATIGGSLEQSALSDSEKELMLQTTKCSSAPPSIIGIPPDGVQSRLPLISSKSDGGGSEPDLGAEGVEALYPTTSDWDKQSSSSMSEMSVACLQDRILQMEETHYSTNEELQATLQELTDLQDQLTELQAENERLAEEKAVLLESLCSQTERLEDCRSQNEMIRHLLLQQTDQEKALNASEREQKLLELLKSMEEEKETIVSQLSELQMAVEQSHEEGAGKRDELASLNDKLSLLQSTIESLNADKKLSEKQLSEAREQANTCQIEMSRMKSQLDMERGKVSDLQQAREIEDKSELDKMLDSARSEKERAEGDVATLTDKLAVTQCEAASLKDSLEIVREELLVTKNNAKKQTSDLEYHIDQLKHEKEQMTKDVQMQQNTVIELEHKCQRHLVDKRELRANISELQNRIKELEEHFEEKERQLKEAEDIHQYEIKEWNQFQEDLLMTVRVANDFKTEAQHELERLVIENKQLKDKVMAMHLELEKAKKKLAAEPSSPPLPIQGRTLRSTSTENPVLSSVEQEMARQNRNRTDTRPLSVKSLIESIESAAKHVKAQNGNDSLDGFLHEFDVRTYESLDSVPATNLTTGEKPAAVIRGNFMKQPLRPQMSETSSIMQEHGNNSFTNLVRNASISDISSAGKTIISNERASLSPNNKNGMETDSPSKTVASPISILANKLDPIRRNSYSNEMLDKKDPLTSLVKGGGSKRNALLKWCQNKTMGYKGIDITNFSSSWNDGLAFCALLNTYFPDKISYNDLDNKDKRRNFTLAFKAAESVGIPCNLNINDMISMERPDWQAVMAYVTAIYKHFET